MKQIAHNIAACLSLRELWFGLILLTMRYKKKAGYINLYLVYNHSSNSPVTGATSLQFLSEFTSFRNVNSRNMFYTVFVCYAKSYEHATLMVVDYITIQNYNPIVNVFRSKGRIYKN